MALGCALLGLVAAYWAAPVKVIWIIRYGPMIGHRTVEPLEGKASARHWKSSQGGWLESEFDLDGDGRIDCRESDFAGFMYEPLTVRIRPGAEPLVRELGGTDACTSKVRARPPIPSLEDLMQRAKGTPP